MARFGVEVGGVPRGPDTIGSVVRDSLPGLDVSVPVALNAGLSDSAMRRVAEALLARALAFASVGRDSPMGIKTSASPGCLAL